MKPILAAWSAALCAIVTGCSPRTAAIPEPANVPQPAAHTTSALVYASDWFEDAVDVYDRTGSHQRIARITSRMNQPAGLATDRLGNLYVADAFGNGVYVYAPGSSSPFLALNDSGYEPYAVAVDGGGNVYVVNAYRFSTDGFIEVFPSVEGFPQSRNEPSYRIHDPDIVYPYCLALDAHNNLYVSYFNASGNGAVDEIPYGSDGPGKNLGLRPGSYFGLAVDAKGNLVAADFYASAIDVFAPGGTKPVKTFGRRGRPWSLAFNPAKDQLFVANFGDNAIEIYAYPAGKLIGTIPGDKGGEFVGVATSP